MPDTSPFDHRPDTELGSALRQALDAGDDAAFVRGVLAALDGMQPVAGPGQWWTVLTAWARPGLVAAMLLIAVAAFSLGVRIGRTSVQSTATATTMTDPLNVDTGQVAVPAIMAGSEAPNVDYVLAVALGR
jgi:hypothetical protein